MFGLSNNWSWLILALVLGVIFVFSKYLQKDLESPHKERVGSRYAYIMFFVTVMFFYFNLPTFVAYVPDRGDIKTLDHAISRLEDQEEKLGKLHQDLNDVKISVAFFVGILGFIVGLTRDYSKALQDDETYPYEDDEKIISIFEEDKNNGK